MAAYLIQLFIYRFVQIILFKYLLSSGNQLFVIVIDDRRNLIQLLEFSAIFVVQLSVFVVMLKKIYLKKYFRWVFKLRQEISPLLGLSIIIIPIVMYLIYQSTFSGQYNGFSLKGLIMNLVFFLLGAISEEFVFRGYFFKLMVKKHKKYAILFIIFQAILFTFTHVNNPDGNLIRVLNIFLAGFLMGLIAIRGFVYVVFFHFLWNFLQAYALGLNVSGYSFTESLNTLFDAPAWENNVYSAVVLGPILVIFLGLYFKKKKLFV